MTDAYYISFMNRAGNSDETVVVHRLAPQTLGAFIDFAVDAVSILRDGHVYRIVSEHGEVVYEVPRF